MGFLDGKVAVITGAGSGMAKASTKIFVREGASVVAADISGAEKDTASEVGAGVFPVHCDVTQESDVEAMMQAALDEFGHIDAVLNVAGIGGPQAIHEFTIEDHEKTMDVNLRGVLLGMKYGIRAMLGAGNGGAIVNWSSIGGLNASHVRYRHLLGEQGGRHRRHQGRCGRVRRAGHPGQRHLPRLHPERDHGCRGPASTSRRCSRRPRSAAPGETVRGGRGRRVPRVRPGVVRERRHHPGRRRLVGQARLTQRITPDSLSAPISSHDKPSSSSTDSVCSPCSGARVGLARLFVELHRRGHERQRHVVPHVDLGDVAVRLHLRVVVQLAGRLHRCPLALEVGERVPPCVEVALPRTRAPAVRRTPARSPAAASMSTKRGSVAISG